MSGAPRTTLCCEMCGSPIAGRAYTITVEGVELTVCERCYRRYSARAERARTDVPMRALLGPGTTPPRLQERPKPVHQVTTQLQPRQAPPPPKSLGPVRGTWSSVSVKQVERFEVVPDYAERVRRARERLGLTQKQLAEKVRVGENVIRRIEQGTLAPTIELARRLERVLGVKLVEPVVEEEAEYVAPSRRKFTLTLGDIVHIRED